MQLEEMSQFFNTRVDTYEEHMRTCVDGANEYYEKTAAHFPERGAIHILDLGCGTGLELDALWKRNPEIEVTGVDLAGDMLAVLRKKHPDKKLHLIQASYFDVDFGQGQFDAAVSVQTMHHFTHEEKISLYRRLCTCLKPGGWYVETDYMAPDSRYEEQCFADYERVKQEQGLGEGFYHFDRPCTVKHQLSMLRTAGFMDAQECWRCGEQAYFWRDGKFGLARGAQMGYTDRYIIDRWKGKVTMDSRLQDVLAGREDNYIFPFYWIKENKREILAQEVQHIQDCGIRAFCVEARPYEHFGEADWWTDMGILLEEAKKRDMKVWLLDDKHFPTGQANGKMKHYPQHRKWHLREEHVDVMGPMRGASVLVSPLDEEAEETLLGAYAYRRTGVKEELEEKAICLTGHVKGRFLYWDVPEGCYRIFLIVKTRKGGSQDYIHLIDKESVKVLLREVYEPHYEHFHQYFGNTFAGFFSDEPQMGNKRFEWLAPDNGFYEYSVGLPGLSLPWSDELARRLQEWSGGDFLPYLAGLWYPMGDKNP